MTREQVERWVAAYVEAWRAPGTEGLDDLFAPDATYSRDPYEEPIPQGLDAIAALWEEERNEGEEFELSHEIVAVENDTAVVRVNVQYRKPREQEYRDLWVIRLDAEGRCTHYEEWPFFPDRPRIA